MATKNTINRSDVRKAMNDVQMSKSLQGDRLLILVSLIAALSTAFILVYLAVDRDRLELVYLQQDRMDVPTLLPKIRSDDDAIRTDRWVRGFVRRFLAYYFLSADDSTDFARKGVAWLHAHSGDAGQDRSEALNNDFKKYDDLRRRKFQSFFPVNDPSALRIRQSSENEDLIFVELPGTYVTRNEQGEAFFDAKIKLVVQRVPISGIDSGLGEINVTGLSVINGTIEFVEDYTRPGEISRHPLFEEAK